MSPKAGWDENKNLGPYFTEVDPGKVKSKLGSGI